MDSRHSLIEGSTSLLNQLLINPGGEALTIQILLLSLQGPETPSRYRSCFVEDNRFHFRAEALQSDVCQRRKLCWPTYSFACRPMCASSFCAQTKRISHLTSSLDLFDTRPITHDVEKSSASMILEFLISRVLKVSGGSDHWKR